MTALATALAETFRATRVVDSDSFGPHATAWTSTTRDLRLLELTARKLVAAQRVGPLHCPEGHLPSMSTAETANLADLDGLWTPSTMTGGTNVALRNPARTSLPAAPTSPGR